MIILFSIQNSCAGLGKPSATPRAPLDHKSVAKVGYQLKPYYSRQDELMVIHSLVDWLQQLVVS